MRYSIGEPLVGILNKRSLECRESHSNSIPPDDRGEINASRTRWWEHEAKLQRSSAHTSRDVRDIRIDPSPFHPSFRPDRCVSLSAATGIDWRSNSKSETNTGGVVRFRRPPHPAVVVPNICRGSASDMESFHKRSSVTNYLIEAGKDFILGRLSRFLDMKVDV